MPEVRIREPPAAIGRQFLSSDFDAYQFSTCILAFLPNQQIDCLAFVQFGDQSDDGGSGFS